MKRTLTQKLGLLGVLSFLSYAAAVVLAPLAYPGYDWMAQAVSDLSAADAPSLALWNQLSALYNVCEVVCVAVVCIGIQGQKTRLLRTGIYLFAIMEWISAAGYRMFPLSSSGYAGAFQDMMHMVVTALVVLLSIVSLSVIIAAGVKERSWPVLRHVRGGRALHDARRRDRHEARARAGFRHRRALQRVRRHGLQRGAGRAPEGAKYRELRKENIDVSNIQPIFIQVIRKPERLCIIKRGRCAEDYFPYCEEVSCDVWGMLMSMRSLCGEPVADVAAGEDTKDPAPPPMCRA